MPPFSDSECTALLRLARRSIEAAVCSHPSEPVPQDAIFGITQGAFVTLHVNGELRGCIGSIETEDPLGETVARCAVSAAEEDPRFSPLCEEDLTGLKIEISVLSKPRPIRAEDVEIGRHGLLVTRGARRGLLLPQVAVEQKFSRERFLDETCHKAGLPSNSWRDSQTEICAFSCEVFSEGENSPRAADH